MFAFMPISAVSFLLYNNTMTQESFSFESEPDLIKELESLRHDWHDEIPDKMLNSTSNPGGDNHYKVRSAWFQQVDSTLFMLEQEGKLSDEKAKDAAVEFSTVFSSDVFTQRKRTLPEHINKANKLLDTVLETIKR